MKIKLLVAAALLSLSFYANPALAGDEYSFDHGPYLQEVGNKGVSFLFTTTGKGFSWVEVKKQGAPDSDAKVYYSRRDGLKEANNTFNAIRVHDLEPGTAYQYRLCSKEITTFQPYKVVYGKEIQSPWYDFKTFSPRIDECSLFAASDIHDDPGKLKKLLELGDYGSCDAMFLVGDITSYCTSAGQPYKSYIDLCVNMFAKEKPFILVRGNHETRGALARDYSGYVPQESGNIYGTQTIGDTFVIFLDCGEDKPDTHPVYAGLTDFDHYRTEQAEWLKGVLQSPDFKKARHRIVMSHFPISEIEQYNKEHGMNDISSKMLNMLNKAGIDLMIAGHTHRYDFHEPVRGKRNYPLLVGSNHSGARLDIDRSGIKMRAFDTDGKTLIEKKFPTKR